ncbi:FtsJ-like methyltransferase-domain-containing protein [Syncephalis plumigaleata]|nr:FtsJ-like methyltransferase-domain-containing protein [Syncephalis plumigaleata]
MNPYTDADIDYKNTLLYSPIPPPGMPINDTRYRQEAREAEERYRASLVEKSTTEAAIKPTDNNSSSSNNTEDNTEDTIQPVNESTVLTSSSNHTDAPDAASFDIKPSDECSVATDMYHVYPTEIAAIIQQLKSSLSSIERSIFMNRAAIKLANIDAMFSLTATLPQNKTLTFVDLAGGPGGFSEYLLWRRHTWGEEAKGWAITLNATSGAGSEKDFDWRRFHTDALARQMLTIIYGPDASDTGDLCNERISDYFVSTVLEQTDQQGVHLVVADGAFDVTGQEHEQELLSWHDKHWWQFVCKFFDLYHPSTVELVYILYRCFETLHIVKPVSSRPANAERYIIGVRFRGKVPHIVEKLKEINKRCHDLVDKSDKLYAPHSIFHSDVVKQDALFTTWLHSCNEQLARRQLNALRLLLRYSNNQQLPPCTNQEAVRRQCFNEWHLPLE